MIDPILELAFSPEILSSNIDKDWDKTISKAITEKFSNPYKLAEVITAIENGTLDFEMPHKAKIPKDTPGEFREVYVGGDLERIICSLLNDACFKYYKDLVHPSCKSYQKGLSCQKTVKHCVSEIRKINSQIVGGKYDFHAFFDTVLKVKVFGLIDRLEHIAGFEKDTMPSMNLIRKVYNNDKFIDVDGTIKSQWSGIRQGNAMASFFADVILYDLDEYMSNKYKFYCRYSDDLIVIGENVEEITSDIVRIVSEYGVSLNPKKIEVLTKDKYFKFLGFSLRGNDITFTKKSLSNLMKELEKGTIKMRDFAKPKLVKDKWQMYEKKTQRYIGGKYNTKEECVSKYRTSLYNKAVNNVSRTLYGDIHSDNNYCRGLLILSTVTNKSDMQKLSLKVMDLLRAVLTGKKKVGGLGFVPTQNDGVISVGLGQNVKANRENTPKELNGFISPMAMWKALHTSMDLYNSLRRNIWTSTHSCVQK